MKNIPLLIVTFLLSISLSATDSTYVEVQKKLDTFESKIESLEKENKNLKNDIRGLKSEYTKLAERINHLEESTNEKHSAVSKTIDEVNTSLGSKISDADSKATNKMSDIDKSLSKTSLWSIVGFCIAVVVLLIIYIVLRRSQASDKSSIILQLTETKNEIEESLIKEFVKQTELMELQVKIAEKSLKSQSRKNEEIDHSLTLKIADEITAMERNMNHMDEKTRGLKQLQRSISKLKENLLSQGYEITELLGKPYNEGMRLVIINSIPEETLNYGTDLISRVIKPQVLYKGVMVQSAEVDVNVGIKK